MAYLTYHKNKKTGVTYVYEAVSRWDKKILDKFNISLYA